MAYVHIQRQIAVMLFRLTCLALVVAFVGCDEDEDGEASTNSTQWILLESVAEWMDYRNMSADIDEHNNTIRTAPEKAAPQERSKLQKLLQQQRTQYKNIFDSFCDLSYREGDNGNEDEWELMHYEDMSTVQRSRNALFRAARFVGEFSCQELISVIERPWYWGRSDG